MALTEIPAELSSTPGIADSSNATAITIDSSENTTFSVDSNVIVQGTHNEGGGLLFIKGTDTAAADKNLGSLCFGNPSDSCLAMIRGVSTDTTAADLRFYTEAQGGAIEERMRIDSSGRVLIGHTAARNVGYSDSSVFRIEGTSYANASIATVLNSNNADGAAIVLGKSRGTSVGSNTVVQSGDNLGVIDFAGSDGTDMAHAGVRLFAQVDGTPGSNDMPGRFIISTTADGASGPTERMRITNDGRVGIATASPSNYSAQFVVYEDQSGAFNSYFLNDNSSGYGLGIRSDSGNQVFFYIGGAHQGTISSSGGTTAYGTSSDYRLKENVVDLPNGITRLKELKPKQFNFIADETNTLRDGFLAHEAQEVVPEAVAGEKDAEINDKGIGYQQMDYGKITPLLTAALQEAIAKIETLEAKVKALEEA